MSKTLIEISDLELKAETVEDYLFVIELLENYHHNNPKEVEPILRLIYMYWIWILENGSAVVPKVKDDSLIDKLKEKLCKLYTKTKYKFNINPEYLFIVGYIMEFSGYYLDEKYYDINRANFETDGLNMLKKALDLEPNNKVYKISVLNYELNTDDLISDSEYIDLCKESKFFAADYFKNRGMMGDYFWGIYSKEDEIERLKKSIFERDS